ncbi:MAG: hypothetical protein NTW54_03830 [Bacteroidetes bacterium]|nr:hypothetical protein [Bacteroidota bacterium]
MDTQKILGVWMDHSVANLIDINSKIENHDINSKFTYAIKEETLNKSENVMHNKENQMQQAFYKQISEQILKHVLLFGPTNAKTELHNYLCKDLHFKDIKIDVEATGKFTDHEKVAFVKNHFNNLTEELS